VESIFAELASNGLVRSCPQATLANYLGGPDLTQAPPPEAKKSKKGGKDVLFFSRFGFSSVLVHVVSSDMTGRIGSILS